VLDVKGIEGADAFDQLITFCDEIVERYEEPVARDRFIRLLQSGISGNFAKELSGQLYDVYRGMKIAHSQGATSVRIS
jgi:hypothetical protein